MNYETTNRAVEDYKPRTHQKAPYTGGLRRTYKATNRAKNF
jgi:hypothetical protein